MKWNPILLIALVIAVAVAVDLIQTLPEKETPTGNIVIPTGNTVVTTQADTQPPPAEVATTSCPCLFPLYLDGETLPGDELEPKFRNKTLTGIHMRPDDLYIWRSDTLNFNNPTCFDALLNLRPSETDPDAQAAEVTNDFVVETAGEPTPACPSLGSLTQYSEVEYFPEEDLIVIKRPDTVFATSDSCFPFVKGLLTDQEGKLLEEFRVEEKVCG